VFGDLNAEVVAETDESDEISVLFVLLHYLWLDVDVFALFFVHTFLHDWICFFEGCVDDCVFG
jgi:hypothetical protein